MFKGWREIVIYFNIKRFIFLTYKRKNIMNVIDFLFNSITIKYRRFVGETFN